jgi:hypothetical protein
MPNAETMMPGATKQQRAGLDANSLVPDAGNAWIADVMPRSRITLGKDLERHFLQIETRGESVVTIPETDPPVGTQYEFFGTAPGGTDLPINDPISLIDDGSSAHSPLIQVSVLGKPSVGFRGTNRFNAPETVGSADANSLSESVVASNQNAHAMKSDTIQYVWPVVRPNSGGKVTEFSYSPHGGPNSLIQFLNPRFAARYVGHREFYGVAHGGSGANVVYLSVLGALRF